MKNIQQKFWLYKDNTVIRCNNPQKEFFFTNNKCTICDTTIPTNNWWKEIPIEQAYAMLKFAGFNENDYSPITREFPIVFEGRNLPDNGARIVIYFTKNCAIRLNNYLEFIDKYYNANVEDVDLEGWDEVKPNPEIREIIKLVWAGMDFSQ
jgi:hypothetical protein